MLDDSAAIKIFTDSGEITSPWGQLRAANQNRYQEPLMAAIEAALAAGKSWMGGGFGARRFVLAAAWIPEACAEARRRLDGGR